MSNCFCQICKDFFSFSYHPHLSDKSISSRIFIADNRLTSSVKVKFLLYVSRANDMLFSLCDCKKAELLRKNNTAFVLWTWRSALFRSRGLFHPLSYIYVKKTGNLTKNIKKKYRERHLSLYFTKNTCIICAN